jgi:hypothetical protein
MAEYSRLAKGRFKAPGTSAVISLPFQPDFVEIWNVTNIQASPASNKVTRAWWDSKLLDNSSPQQNLTMLELYPNGSTTFTAFDTIVNSAASPGINAFTGGQILQFGPSQQIVSATAANPAVFTVTAHGYAVGDTVVMEGLYQTATTGMPQIAGIPFAISAVTANTFTIKWDASGSNYTALSGSPTGSTVRKILYPNAYFPGTNIISALTLGATTTVVTTESHEFQVGQEIAFRIPSQWRTTQLNALPNIVTPGSPIYGYVISVTDQWTFVVNINSSGYTAFNVNQPVSSVSGLSFPQVIAVGDVNTGGVQISSGSALYPSPLYSVGTLNSTSTINGPAIVGAFVNNTSQGFTIGAGVGVINTNATIMTTNDIIYYHAYFHDYGNP